MVHSSYLHKMLDKNELSSMIPSAIEILSPLSDKFDSIAFCGMSGAVVAPILGYLLQKDLIIVRKPEVKAHSTFEVEGKDCDRYLIVDDFISSGKTIQTIVKTINESPVIGLPFAVYLWKSRGDRSTVIVENLTLDVLGLGLKKTSR